MIYTSKDAIKVRVYETYLAKEKMNSDLFDSQVRLPKYLLLETYAEIIVSKNPRSRPEITAPGRLPRPPTVAETNPLVATTPIFGYTEYFIP